MMHFSVLRKRYKNSKMNSKRYLRMRLIKKRSLLKDVTDDSEMLIPNYYVSSLPQNDFHCTTMDAIEDEGYAAKF